MSQHDYNIQNATFPSTRSDINDALGAIATNNSGNSAPATTYANQWWFDSDDNKLYMRNKDNDAWVEILTIGATSDKVESIGSGGGLTITTADNTDTLTLVSTDTDSAIGPNLNLYRNAGNGADADNLSTIAFAGNDDAGNATDFARITAQIEDASNGSEDVFLYFRTITGGTERQRLGFDSGSTVFNEEGVDVDFRVESNNKTHALFVDAGNDRIGVGTSSPVQTMHIRAMGNPSNDTGLILEGNATDSNVALYFYNSAGTEKGRFLYDTDDNFLQTKVNGAERMRITSDGNFGFHNAGSSSQQVIIENQASGSGKIGLKITNPSSSAAMNGQEITCVRSGSSAYTFLICRSNSASPDTEFNVRGDGEIFADGGTAMNTPADYAEIFEWKDGNTDSEVRFGYSVILDGDKIVKASDSDDASKIIGVVSAKPAVLGDAAWNKWSQKYLKDEWNQYILEEYTSTEWVEVEDGRNINHSYETDKIPSDIIVPSDAKVITTESDGVTKLTRRKINPDYDSSETYVPRQERKEWNAVGLMGKLRLRKGQPTGSNWIKMRDINNDVEEWLVR